MLINSKNIFTIALGNWDEKQFPRVDKRNIIDNLKWRVNEDWKANKNKFYRQVFHSKWDRICDWMMISFYQIHLRLFKMVTFWDIMIPFS